MTADPVPADAETTTLIKSTSAPLPPYATSASEASAPVPMSPLAPTPPPARPAPSPSPATSTEPQTMADAMLEISRPPLAAQSEFAASTADTGQIAVLDAPPLVSQAPAEAPTQAAAPTYVVPAPTAAAPTSIAAALPPPATEVITCPECGTTAQVTLNRRESMDFCRTCDYPLFWTPAKVLRDPSGPTDESLRRLPGQAGRATVASLPCPFCYEPNSLSAVTCLRCGRPMHPVEEPPPPAPVYIAPPAPVVVAPQQKVAWWVWALLGLGAAAVIVLVVLIATHTIG